MGDRAVCERKRAVCGRKRAVCVEEIELCVYVERTVCGDRISRV